MRRLLGWLYLFIIIGLPLLTFSGWLGFSFILFGLPIIFVLSICTLIKYSHNTESGYKWLLCILGTYIFSLLLIRDVGDGSGHQGFEALLSRLAGQQHLIRFIPESIGIILGIFAIMLFFIFLTLNIVFLVKNFKKEDGNQ